MKNGTKTSLRPYSPAALCRMEPSLIEAVANRKDAGKIALFACLVVLAGTMAYGAVFGSWHSLRQACYVNWSHTSRPMTACS